MKKILTLIMLLVSLATASAKCTWSSVNIEQMSSENYYLWRITGNAFKDTCVKYEYNVIDLSTNKVLTNLQRTDLFPRIYLPHKGKYRFDLKLKNTCTGCDTTIYDYVDYHYFNKCVLNYRILSTYDSSCIDSLAGELTKMTTEPANWCWWYGFDLIKNVSIGNVSLDSISEDRWKNDPTLFNGGFSYDMKDVVYRKSDTLDFARKLNYKFRKPGRYVLKVFWQHYCIGNDTTVFIRLTIDPCVTLKVEDLIVTYREPKVIGMYDMLGRKIESPIANEPYIILYDNGQRRKVIKVQ